MTNAAAAPDGGAGVRKTPARPHHFFITASFVAAAAAVWLTPPSTPVALIFISLAVGAAGACAIALHAFLTALLGRSGREQTISATTRAALEREKLLAMRSLKELEFDRAMGKVSAADAAPMEARLRERAFAIMRELDERAALRARIEEDAAQQQAPASRLEISAVSPLEGADGSVEPVTCPACATANDHDARFCKACGAKL